MSTQDFAKSAKQEMQEYLQKAAMVVEAQIATVPDLAELGASDLPMAIISDNLAKILSEKEDHQLPPVLLKKLPVALAEPIAGKKVLLAKIETGNATRNEWRPMPSAWPGMRNWQKSALFRHNGSKSAVYRTHHASRCVLEIHIKTEFSVMLSFVAEHFTQHTLSIKIIQYSMIDPSLRRYVHF
jgi:hypothetical protein